MGFNNILYLCVSPFFNLNQSYIGRIHSTNIKLNKKKAKSLCEDLFRFCSTLTNFLVYLVMFKNCHTHANRNTEQKLKKNTIRITNINFFDLFHSILCRFSTSAFGTVDSNSNSSDFFLLLYTFFPAALLFAN